MLLNSDYVPVQEISVTLKKTNRSVRNYINELNNLLVKKGASITSVYNKGYCLNINDEALFSDFVSQMDY